MIAELHKSQAPGADGIPCEPEKKRVRQSIARHLMIGFALVALLVFGAGGWVALAEITSAVIAPVTLVVDSNIKKVQHPTGGTVGALRVRDGDKVKAGDVVLRLDDTVTLANLAVISNELDALYARQARLEAEREGATTMPIPPELADRITDPEVADIIASEQRLFETRLANREGQKAQLLERITQIQKEIEGNLSQEHANAQELEWARHELAGARELWKDRLITIARYTALEREVPRLEGVRGQLMAAVARAGGQILEIRLQITQIDRELGSEVPQELRQTERRIAELTEHRVAAEDELRKIDIRAPQSGSVHQLAIHAVGEVIVPDGSPIMLIVPDSDELKVEARVRPRDIDQINLGDTATIRLSAFNQRITPEISGTVSRISADISNDPRTGESHYTVRITIPETEMARLGDLRLVPGMPVKAFVQTGSRSVLSYILKPISDQIVRAFREG